jgi:anti-sigma factor RsiW
MGSREVGSGEAGDASRLGPEITCREFVEFLDDYVARELPEAARMAFDAHLAACPSCVAYMKTYQATVRAGKRAFTSQEGPVPSDIPEELVRAVLAACRKP